jgi:hypothetical protein
VKKLATIAATAIILSSGSAQAPPPLHEDGSRCRIRFPDRIAYSLDRTAAWSTCSHGSRSHIIFETIVNGQIADGDSWSSDDRDQWDGEYFRRVE